jgi:hypothetical protein
MYSSQLGKSMNHGQSFIPGRVGRRNSAPGAAPAPNPLATAPTGAAVAPYAPILKQRGGKLARPRPRTPLQQAIYPQAV